MSHREKSISQRIWSVRHDLLFSSIIVAAFVWRLIPLLNHGSPTGTDWGNDLVVGHRFLGNTVGNQGLTYPPMMPLIVSLLNPLISITLLTSVIGAVASTLPFAGIYFALRSIAPHPAWYIAPLPLLITSSTSELMAFGGAPQLIANGCFPVVLVAAALLFDTPTRKRAIAFGVSVFLLAGSSEEVFGQVIVCLLIFLLLEASCRPRSFLTKFRRSFSYFALSLSPLLILIPIYVPLVKQLGFSQTTRASAIFTPAFNWGFLTREDHYFWNLCLFLSVLVVYYCLVHINDFLGPFLRASSSVLLTSIMFEVFIPDIRFSYLLPVGVSLSLALVGYFITRETVISWGLSLNLLLAAFFLGNVGNQIRTSNQILGQQITFYGDLAPSSLDLKALDFVRMHTPRDSLFAVTSVSSYIAPIGWWVEGYAERPALVQGSLSDLYYASQKIESRLATKIFESFPSVASLRLAREHKVNYLFIFRGWYKFNALATQNFLNSHPKLVVLSNSDAIILRVPSKGSSN